MSAKLVVKDYGLMDFFARMKEAKSVYSEVGLLDDSAKGQHKREGSDFTVAQIGSVHEFGSNSIPARPFLRPTFDENKQTLAKSLTEAMYDFVFARNKMTPEKALGIASAKLVALTRTKITNGIAPPNAPSTIAAKLKKGKWKNDPQASDKIKPLIDTGRMLNSITWIVKRK